jgi:hypothetical protein
MTDDNYIQQLEKRILQQEEEIKKLHETIQKLHETLPNKEIQPVPDIVTAPYTAPNTAPYTWPVWNHNKWTLTTDSTQAQWIGNE